MERMDILSLPLDVLEAHMAEMGEPKFRAKQIFNWLHQKQVTEFAQMTTLSLQLRERLDRIFCINRLNIARRLASSIDDTVKYLYELPDGNFVETVLMDYHHGKSLCISTQVGCRMGCQFCASTIAGYVRDLTPAELLLQIYETQRDAGCRIDSLVLMGIGEPLDNFENVIQFFRLLSDPNGFGMSLRHVTLSTCGLVPRIRALAEMKLGVTLSVSLHSPDNGRRSEIMPVNRRYSVEELLDACRYYFEKTGRRVTMEYAVIDGVNSTKADAKRLAERLRGMQCHVNLIPVNPIAERDFRSMRQTVERFQKELTALGIHATIRRTLGSDIQAACGQLRRDADGRKNARGISDGGGRN
ncbi:23S rRNA (adenine(2503)-C(2))-methyltransferase RlmN [Ruminococcus sp.]|uniref:23S rRNA (adenine(2503)-C(2))-methyltransferase RlmN n=1 Tax=Ruminococcus sp. TaxID=41978 RepID=UPI0025DA467B|nr:23S rRNA (adenine(2503)-C(2))-methyltransferase RlmN [Ruminococcus sp.]